MLTAIEGGIAGEEWRGRAAESADWLEAFPFLQQPTLYLNYDAFMAFRCVTCLLTSLRKVLLLPSMCRLKRTTHYSSSLVDDQKLIPVVFSNGTTSMIQNSVARSKELAPYAGLFHNIVSVDPTKKFKPAPETYRHLADRIGKERSEMNEIWFIIGNPFDVMGAINAGMNAAWVDRAGLGWTDSMNGEAKPSVVARDLVTAVLGIKNHEF